MNPPAIPTTTRQMKRTRATRHRQKSEINTTSTLQHIPTLSSGPHLQQPTLLEPDTSPHHISPFTITPRSKVPSPMIGNHQNHNNNTRIGSPGPPPTHHALGQTTPQASHKHTPRTQLLSSQSSTKINNPFYKIPLSKSTKSAIALWSSITSDSGLLRSLSKGPLRSAISIFRSRYINELVNELLLLLRCWSRKGRAG